MKGVEGDGAREFLISRAARDRYKFFEPIFSLRDGAITGDLSAARTLAFRMNQSRDLARYPELTVRAGRLYTMGLIEEILHFVIRFYRRGTDPSTFANAHMLLAGRHGGDEVDRTLLDMVRQFPPRMVYREGAAPEEYLDGVTEGAARREIVLEEVLLLVLANANPAYRPYHELFDDSVLRSAGFYGGLPRFFEDYFRTRPAFGPEGQTLFEILRAPALASPDSLEGQLDYILKTWGAWIAPFLTHILTGLDLIREEDKPAFAGFGGMPPVPDFRTAWEAFSAGQGRAGERDHEYERYTMDRDWMSTVVLLAKSVYVWLHQLSVKYGRDIRRLDQIPDEELDLMARWGFTGLWLIGVWERSIASREIKRRMGNPEAEASAYSLWDYVIAGELGGQGALEDLKSRAGRRGIRLAADMVPNHTGIYSRWVLEHPDWYIQLEHPPFPAYRFTGPDLSQDPGVGIYLEDGYWRHSDAAVVFKRVDRRSSQVRYLYHGNDGTGLPWNDTAQLNYLLPEVREAVIGAIMHVASLFPIIRFDAAMTLSKRHYRRLWFPPPGTGGDIPSRAGSGMSADEFQSRFPQEFWREVVDRASVERRDTLLLAEAFWLMEGYFVRTLGMHRVYNSAFMNMLKREANAEYRQTIKNILEFDPQILKRFVNFMNNPDEESAVAQFGKGDKYFGTAVLLATLPGLPMVGHGQVEGFTEKYGMEYRRSYWDESADEHLVARHEREIFPLFHRRRIFSEVEHFTLYDLYRDNGTVDENIFAYSNRHGIERGLVIYHNAWSHTAGWLRESAATLERGAAGERPLVRRTLGEELGLDASPGSYCIFRDEAHGLEYLRECRELVERGLRVMLGAYQYHVFLDFRQMRDDGGEWSELCRFLDGRGVDSVEKALRELILTPLHAAFREVCGPAVLRALLRAGADGSAMPPGRKVLRQWEADLGVLLERCRESVAGSSPLGPLAERISTDLHGALSLAPARARKEAAARLRLPPGSAALLPETDSEDLPFWRVLLPFLTLARLGELSGGEDPERSVARLDEWLLSRETERILRELGCAEETVSRESLLLRVLAGHRRWMETAPAGGEGLAAALETLLKDPDVQKFLGVNRYRDEVWFVKERFEELAAWLGFVSSLDLASGVSADRIERSARISRVAAALHRAAENSSYVLERLVRLAGLAAAE